MQKLVSLLQISLLTVLLLASHCLRAAVGDQLGCLAGDCENGVGTLVQKTDDGLIRYRGPFVNGKYQGFGKLEMFDKKVTYKGTFLAGIRQGRGAQWDGEHNVYLGQWRNDKRNGQGLQAYKVKEWAEDKYTEFWLKDNTENYQGSFLNDNIDGQGTYRWPDGVKYTGGWAANKKNGAGYFLYPTGLRSDRVFSFDERVYEIQPDL